VGDFIYAMMEKRVLQIFGKLGRGGLESFVMNLYRVTDKTQIQFDFLLTSPGGEYEVEAKALGARIFYSKSRALGLRQYKKDLDFFFAKHIGEFQAVHLHASSLSSIEPLVYAKKYNVPIRIIHSHSSSVKRNLKFRLFHQVSHLINKTRIKSLATHYFGCSDKALDWMYAYTGIRSKAIMINNGIETSKFAFNIHTRNEVRNEFGLTNQFVVGHIGSFIHVKNHSFLIKLFRELLKDIPDAKLILIGDGELRDAIIRQIHSYGIENKVILTGSRGDINRLLQAMDLLIMPSFFEGLPVSLVEAQCAGLPIFASDTISKDVAITPNITFLSLKEDLSVWIESIKKIHKEIVRQDSTEYIVNAGFDINQTVSFVCDIYLDKA